MIRGDRRTKPRKTKDRRDRARTPGRLKHVVDAVYKTERQHKEKKTN